MSTVMNGFKVGDKFLAYWQQNGGLDIFGYPISDQIAQRLADGKRYMVQYFERARLELHPEYANTPAEVLLGRLGALVYPTIDLFPLIGQPTISKQVFTGQLTRKKSPVLTEATGDHFFNVIIGYKLDPNLLLGMFLHESEGGTYEHSPVAKPAMPDAKNWGNIRPNPDLRKPPGGRAVRRVDSVAYRLFRGYNSWEDSLRDACEKLTQPPYLGLTLRATIHKWAPKEDGNDPDTYTDQLVEWATAWWEASKL